LRFTTSCHGDFEFRIADVNVTEAKADFPDWFDIRIESLAFWAGHDHDGFSILNDKLSRDGHTGKSAALAFRTVKDKPCVMDTMIWSERPNCSRKNLRKFFDGIRNMKSPFEALFSAQCVILAFSHERDLWLGMRALMSSKAALCAEEVLASCSVDYMSGGELESAKKLRFFLGGYSMMLAKRLCQSEESNPLWWFVIVHPLKFLYKINMLGGGK